MPLLSTPDRKSPLKPLILTPPVSTCCDSNIQIRNRPSFPIVYTRNGTFVAASYHGQCQKCKRLFYPSHYEDPDSNTNVLHDLSLLISKYPLKQHSKFHTWIVLVINSQYVQTLLKPLQNYTQ